MPRGHMSKRIADADAIRLFAEHHITQVRRRKNGEIVAVKHAVWGWVAPKEYYLMQEIHHILPQFVAGGYQFNAWVYSSSIEVFGVGLPVGGMLAGISELFALQDLSSSDPKIQTRGIVFLLAPLLPFGALLSIFRYFIGTVEIAVDVGDTLGHIADAIGSIPPFFLQGGA